MRRGKLLISELESTSNLRRCSKLQKNINHPRFLPKRHLIGMFVSYRDKPDIPKVKPVVVHDNVLLHPKFQNELVQVLKMEDLEE